MEIELNTSVLKPIAQLVLVSSLAMAGCASDGKGEKVIEDTRTEYQIWKAEKPDATAADTGIASGNLITSGIAGLYQKTLDLDAKYQGGLNNSKVASTLEAIRLEQGEEVWKKEVASLKGKDKREYKAFMKNNISLLAVAVDYGVEATKLAFGIMNFNYNEYITNPFAIIATLAAVGTATEQIGATTTALGFMVEARNSYQDMLDYKGR